MWSHIFLFGILLIKAPSFWVHCDLNVLFLTGSDGCLSSRLSLPGRSPSPRKRLHLKFPNNLSTTASFFNWLMKWPKMVAKFDLYGTMINRGNRILIVSRAQLSAMLMASVANQMLVLSYLALETLFKFFVYFISIHYIWLNTVGINWAQNVRAVLPQKNCHFTPIPPTLAY